MSEALRISWDEVLQKSVVEFLNVLAYIKDRNAWRQSSINNSNGKQWKNY